MTLQMQIDKIDAIFKAVCAETQAEEDAHMARTLANINNAMAALHPVKSQPVVKPLVEVSEIDFSSGMIITYRVDPDNNKGNNEDPDTSLWS